MRDAFVVLHPSVGCKRRCLRRIPRGGPSSRVSLPLRSPRLSRLRTGDLIHAAISGCSPIESDANVTVGLIAREKVRIWTCLVSLVTMALCVGHSLLNTWGLFNWDSNRTAMLPSDKTRLHTHTSAKTRTTGLADDSFYYLCNSARKQAVWAEF